MAGEIERAELFRNVDELLAWKKTFEKRQAELIMWMNTKNREIEDILKGVLAMVETDTVLGERMDIVSDRIDIVNKRLRKLEENK